MSVRTTILEEMSRIAYEQKKKLQPLRDDTPLLKIDFDSLCYAILVARLEEKLGIDPFRDEHVDLPVTLGDLVNMYERASPTPESDGVNVASDTLL